MGQNLAARVGAILELDPARNAIEYQQRQWCWGELKAAMQAFEALLQGQCIGTGAPVGMLLRNRPASFAAMLQVLLSGRCVVTINPFQSPEKVAADIAALDCPVYVADAQDWAIPQLRDAVAGVDSLGISLSQDDALEATFIRGLDQPGEKTHAAALPGIGILMLTSGTTGPAKRIQLAYANLERALLDAQFYETGGKEAAPQLRNAVVLATQPLVHIGGIWAVVSAVLSGRGIVLLEKFSVEAWHDAVRRHKLKLAALPPTAIRMIFDANVPKEDIASLLAIRSGTAPLDPEFQQAFEARYGIPILNSYGATEFAGGVAGWTLDDHRKHAHAKRASVGRAQPGCELRIVDREGFAPLPAGEVGLLEVRAKHVGNGEWMRTTDLAELDADGFLYIRGRADDAIIRGGFKVLPSDVAKVFLKHPSVKDASVVGLEDERLGAVPVVAVELREGAPLPTMDELMALARRDLTSYQIPVAIRIVDELPRTPSLKISQPGVRALFEGA
ncbi:MAG: fatty acid--CoA ligase family protein [Pseudoxanthomonas sp.]